MVMFCNNRFEVNVVDFQKAIMTSKNIYPDVIKKAMPQFEVLFADQIAECNNMTGLVIPDGVETLEMDAFACCANLVNVRLPSTLKTISRGVFWDCPGLTEITIPAGVTTIGEFAFFYCNNLMHVYNYAPEPQSVSVIFKFPYVKIHVPAASVGLYRNAQHWEALEITGDL